MAERVYRCLRHGLIGEVSTSRMGSGDPYCVHCFALAEPIEVVPLSQVDELVRAAREVASVVPRDPVVRMKVARLADAVEPFPDPEPEGEASG